MKVVLQTRIFKKIEEIPPEEWNRVFPNVLESYPFFKSLDQSDFEQFSFYYLLIYEGHRLAGATSCFLMNYPMDTTVQGPLKKVACYVKKIFPHFFNLKVLVCGAPMAQGRIGVVEETQAVIEAILQTMEKIAREEKAAILAFKDFDSSYTGVLDSLQERGFYKFESLPTTLMDLCFESFDDYLKTLSPASRKGIKRTFKKVDGGVKIDLEVANEPNGVLDEVHGLYLETVAKAARNGDLQFETVPKAFFENISRNMPHETKYFLWRVGKKLVAFAFCLTSGGYFIDYYLGFDYSVAYDYHLYYVRFRDLMNWCIENKIKKYEMGATGYEAKRRLGFDFVRLYGYARLRNPWFNPLFKILCTFLKPENFEPIYKDMERKESLKKVPS